MAQSAPLRSARLRAATSAAGSAIFQPLRRRLRPPDKADLSPPPPDDHATDEWGAVDRRSAAWSVGCFLCIGALVAGLLAFLSPAPSGLGRAVATSLPILFLALGTVTLSAGQRLPGVAYLALALFGEASAVLLAVVTDDRSPAGPLTLCLPVLYASSQLRPRGAYLSLAGGIAGQIVLSFASFPIIGAIRIATVSSIVISAVALLLIQSGITQRHLTEALRHQASVDPLTGLVTRRVLDEAASGALASIADKRGTALILVDLDKFKSINDEYGHPAGDAALVHVAAVLNSNVRQGSVVARLGGDELAVLLPGCDHSSAVHCAERLVKAIREHPLPLPGGRNLPLAISAGVAHAPSHAVDLTDLYQASDSALYEAKRSGRGRVGEPVSPNAPAR